MGQTDSKKKIQQQFDIYKIEKDGNALLKSKKDSKEYLMRIVTCASQADMDRLKALLECRAQLKNHHLLTLVEIKQKQQDFICSIHYKMYLVLEYSFKNLAQEVKERSSSIEKSYFQESDIWSILYSCCTALNVLYSNGATHESLTAQQIFINKDGFVKIAQPLLYGLEKNHLQALRTKDENIINVHLSPEIIGCLDDQNFFYYDKEKSDIFVLAMIVIDIALLSNHYLYDPNKKRPLFEDIRGLLAQVGERYSNNLVTVLSEMVKIQSRMRPNLIQIIDKVEKFNNIGEDFTVETQSNMKSNEVSSERGQQKYLFQKILNKQDFEDVKKKTEPIAPIVYAAGPQEQSLTIKQPVITFNQQSFDGRVFAVTPQQSNFQGPQQPHSQRIIKVVNQQTIAIPIQENFNIYQRSRSIDSIKVTSKEYSHVEQVKTIQMSPSKPSQPKNIQYESNRPKQPIFSHEIPEIYNILMSSKAGFKNESFKQQKQTVVNKEYAPLPPLRNTENQRVIRVTNLRNFPHESVSRAGDDSQIPPFQPMELRKNISHTQSERQPPSNYYKKDFQQPAPDPFASPKTINNAFSNSPIKPNPFSGSNPFPGSFTASSVPFAGSAAGVYGAGNSSPIVSSSFIPSFPSPRQGESFTCRSGFSHLAHLHNNDGEDIKLEFVKQDIPDRGRYEGYKCNDQKNGHGILYFKDGGHYEGEWKNDKMHGFGKLYYENGKIAYEGHWENDQFNGQGRVYNSEPVVFNEEFNYKDFSELGNRWTYYEGQFKNDSKHGKGYIKLTNGEMFEGIFDHDMIEGNGIFYKRKGQIVIGFWIDNKLFLNQSYEHDKK